MAVEQSAVGAAASTYGCVSISGGDVQCYAPDNRSPFSLNDMVTEASQINPLVNSFSQLQIYAQGGAGGNGTDSPNTGGAGGLATTITSVNDIINDTGSSTVEYEIGEVGGTTLVASVADQEGRARLSGPEARARRLWTMRW